MTKSLNWGLIGTGNIARSFADGLKESRTGRLVAIGSRTRESAAEFAMTYPATCHGSYEELLADPDVEVVYISTPHPLHAEWAIKSAEAGKHILCEKPLTLNAAEAMAVIEAARANDVFLMEAFMYRCHPQTLRLVELIQEKAIGEVRLVDATFSFRAGLNLESRLFKQALGGGGILDVGGYCTSMARLIAGAAQGKLFADPTELLGLGKIGAESRVDEAATALLRFPGGIVAQLATGVRLNLENAVHIWGTEGHISIPMPWVVSKKAGTSKIFVHRQGQAVEEVEIVTERGLYAFEADTVAEHLEARQSPRMSWADSLGNMQTLDRWRRAIGFVYDAEKAEAQTATVAKRPLARSKSHRMQYGELPGVRKPISRLILGVDNNVFPPHIAVMLDDFFTRGGNCFDTAHIYGSGISEGALGNWIKQRGLREDVVILDKGAHTPFCFPEQLTKQFLLSLERLETDYADIYMMHRDNPDVPAGEFVEVLNEHKNAGRMHAFGASNWTTARIEEANAYADKKGLTGFCAVSNNFSLAQMVDPVWPGCIAFSDAISRAWLEQTQMPLLAWSSQSRGFFTERAGLDQRDDADLVRCWYSEENFRRRERAIELAKQKQVLPINIALAYVLSQPFPTFALIGPRLIEETRTTLPGLDLRLTPDELRWLNPEA